MEFRIKPTETRYERRQRQQREKAFWNSPQGNTIKAATLLMFLILLSLIIK